MIHEDGPPALVAVECDFAFFDELRGRRGDLRVALSLVFCGGAGAAIPSDDFLDAVSNTLAYEDEVVRELVNGVPVADLDHGRRGHSGDRIAHRTWHTLRALLTPLAPTENPWVADLADAPVALQALTTSLHTFSAATEAHDFHRDETWTDRLLEWCPEDAHGWVLVVVGALHATYYKGELTLRRRLEEAGRPVDAIFPCFQPPADW